MQNILTKLKQPKIQIVLTVALVLIVIVIGKFSADVAARSYQKSLTSWQDSRVTLQQRVQAALFSDKIIMGRQETQAEYDAQNTACQAALSLKQDADKGSLVPKQLGFNLFGGLSGNYRKVKHYSDAHSAAFANYATVAREQFGIMTRECGFYAARSALGVQVAKDREKINLVTDKKGVVQRFPQGAIVCEDPAGCIPADPQRVGAYVDAYRQAEVGSAQKYIELYKKDCGTTFLKPICGDYITYYEKTKATHENLLAVVDKWKRTTDNPEVRVASQAIKDAENAEGAMVKAKFAAAFPDADMTGSFETRMLLRILRAAETTMINATASITEF